MARRFYGSVCLTDLLNAAKAGHSAFKKAESNGKIYGNVTLWLNEEADDKGNKVAIHLASAKDVQEPEKSAKKVYIANFKEAAAAGEAPVKASDLAGENLDDLPF